MKPELVIVDRGSLVDGDVSRFNISSDEFWVPLFFYVRIPGMEDLQCRAEVVSENWMRNNCLKEDNSTICTCHGFILARSFNEPQVETYIRDLLDFEEDSAERIVRRISEYFLVE